MIVEFSRRKFLLAAGGTALALPVLEALTPPKALAAADQARRVLFFITPNGTPVEGRPTGTGKTYSLGKVHAGLKDWQDKMLYVGGLDGAAATLSNGDPHATGYATMLSGRKCLPGTQFKHGACFQSATCQSTGWGDGPSLDYDIGQSHKMANVPIVFPMLNFSVKNCPADLYTRSSYSAPGVPITPMADPQVTFNTIFGMPGGGGAGGSGGMVSDAMAKRILMRRMSVLDDIQGEIKDLQTKLSAADKARLDQHVSSLRELEMTLQSQAMRPSNPAGGMCNPGPAPTLKAGIAVQRNAGGMETNVNDDKMDNLAERHKVWHQMIVQAFACDVTRVITFMNTPSRSDTFMPWLSSEPDASSYPGTFTKPHHQASHDNDIPTLVAMDHWYAKQIAALADALSKTNGIDGKPLFDNSAIVWFNELSNGPNHTHEDKTHTIVGSLGGFFKRGQAVQFPKGTPSNVLLTALAQAMGLATSHYGGTDAKLQGGDVAVLKA